MRTDQPRSTPDRRKCSALWTGIAEALPASSIDVLSDLGAARRVLAEPEGVQRLVKDEGRRQACISKAGEPGADPNDAAAGCRRQDSPSVAADRIPTAVDKHKAPYQCLGFSSEAIELASQGSAVG